VSQVTQLGVKCKCGTSVRNLAHQGPASTGWIMSWQGVVDCRWGWWCWSLMLPGWTVQGLNNGVGKIFHTHPDWPWDPPSLLYKGYEVSSPVVKRPGHGINHPSLSNTKVKERTELQLYSPLSLHRLFKGKLHLLKKSNAKPAECTHAPMQNVTNGH
jgi:hypothetical protein